ncbi:MAG: HDOD domain-containing protein [Leptolyngbya sp. PLA3]|nr:MAG: HDOD domain-containing protein [Cyanobacteria bacterium CYA]MCE7967737.1 HDOD domain-containing protein [Leptolyngbya sp. PL-A3]
MSAHPVEGGHRIELIVREVDRLGTLSPVATRLLEAAGIDEVDVGELVRLLEMDPALSATLLRLCRTVDRGLGDRVKTVRHAVSMLGLETVRSVVLGIEVLDVLRSEEERRGAGEAPGFDVRGFWMHAVAVASASDLIAKHLRHAGLQAGEAFLAGLLHGLGRLVLHLVLPQAYDRALLVAQQRRSTSAAIERTLLGMDHHTAGRRLAERWRLPEAVRDVIWFHGQAIEGVPESSSRELVGVVTLARTLCQRQHLGWSGDFAPVAATEPLARRLGLEAGRVEAIVPQLIEEVAERCEILGLGEQSGPEVLLGAIVQANRRLGQINETLDREARALHRRARVGEAITFFHECWCGDEPVEHTLSCVSASLRQVLKPSFCAVLWWTGEQGWQLARQGPGARSECVSLPDLHVEPIALAATLSDLRGRSAPASVVLGSVEWLPEAADDGLRAMPMVMDRDLVALVLHDADVRGWNESSELAPIRAVWASAVRVAEALARSRALEDALASSNRVLGEMQAELAECESLARLGEMTAGAAHEMNNPLAVIKGRAQLLASRLGESDLGSSVSALVRAADHLSGLISELNRLACVDGPRLSEVGIEEVIERALARAGERLPGRPEVEVSGVSGGLRLRTDRELLSDALAELIVNAEESGSQAKVRVEVYEAPGDGRLYVRVVDRGRGMSERAIRHAFDPFFSEKPAGRQRGLGLARARRCIELLGGRIRLEAHREGGTIATIGLDRPCVMAPAA